MKVLVTGSSGFIGRHLVRALLDRGDEVAALDIHDDIAPSQRAKVFPCDIRDDASLGRVFTEFQPELVCHLAARTDLNETRDISGYHANIAGVRNLVEAVRRNSSVRRVVYTSSQLVCRIGYIPAHDADYCPNTLYGESKVMTENIVRESNGGGKEWILARPTTVWGPGMSPHYQRFLHMIRTRRYFHIGKSSLCKSYGYIGNIVFQYLALMDAPTAQVDRRMFYLADYEPLDLIAWANALQQAMNAPPIPTVPEIVARGGARVGDVLQSVGFSNFPFTSFRLNNVLTQYVFDLSATESVCGRLPYSMQDGVRQTAEWFLSKCENK